MNEVDKLYHKWRDYEKQEARCYWTDHFMEQNPRWYDKDERFLKARAVAADSETLKEYIAKYEHMTDPDVKANVKIAEQEIKKRQEKYGEFVVKVRKEQLQTRGRIPSGLEQALANQNQLNSAKIAETTKTIQTKGRKTMAQTTKTVKVNTKIDVAALVQAKMAEKMMDAVGDGKDIPLTKLTIMQSLANGGSIDVNELIRAKQTEKLLKDLNENKDLSIGKLMTYQALTSEDGFDINALIQAQFIEKLFAEDEKTK